MFIYKLDWLTPPITLYYQGDLIHSSITSVIISLIGYCSSIVIGLYLSVDFFKRKSPTVFYFNRYTEDSGIYALNSEGVFHNFQFITTTGATPVPIDTTYIRVIGTERSIQEYIKDNHTSLYDHWVYGLCDNGTDIKGIENLYEYDTFNQSYCIKKYYKKDDEQYYSISDDKFRWPHTDHGTSHPNKTFYGIVFESCKQDELWGEISGGRACKTETQIKDYVKNHYLRFYMVDHYPDVYNYKKPFSKYLYNIDTTLSSGSYTYNHINFNPAKIVTHDGLFFDHDVDEIGYIFDQNAQETGAYEGAYVAFYFWLKNTLVIYERTYKKIQDVLAEIEGMIDLVIFIATIINNFVADFITLRDTSHVLFELRSKNINRTEITRIIESKRRSMFIRSDPPRKKNVISPLNYYFISTKNDDKSKQLKMSSGRQKIGTSSRLMRKDQIMYQRYTGNNNILNRFLRNPGIGYSNTKQSRQLTKGGGNKSIDIYKNVRTDTQKDEDKIDKSDNFTEDNIEPAFDPFKEEKLSFGEYVYNTLFFCKKGKNSIEAYENFRMKIISEENMIQNYLDIHTINKTLQKINKEEEEENGITQQYFRK